jgi:ankyrin repeat protein
VIRGPILRYLAALTAMGSLSACDLLTRSRPGDIRAYTEVVQAATAGDIATVRAALDRDPRLIRRTEWSRATLLHNAVGHDEAAMAAFLIERGAKVNARTSDGLTPLHMAAQNGNVPIITLLLNQRARINPIDGKGWTPLDRAVKWKHPEAAQFLKARGGKPGLGAAAAD